MGNEVQKDQSKIEEVSDEMRGRLRGSDPSYHDQRDRESLRGNYLV